VVEERIKSNECFAVLVGDMEGIHPRTLQQLPFTELHIFSTPVPSLPSSSPV